MHDNHPLLRCIPLGVMTLILAVVAWAQRVFQSLLLLLPGRPAARPAHPVHTARGGIGPREVPVAGE